MGRRYAEELAALDLTATAASEFDVSPLADWLTHEAGGGPLAACGSGGSSASCVFAALLHELRFNQPASWTTPLELVRGPPVATRSALLVSASGRNSDILAAADYVVTSTERAFALTARPNSQLQERVSPDGTRCLVTPTPNGKDGFLATNSLLSSMIAIQRAYLAGPSMTLGAVDEVELDRLAPILARKRGLVVIASQWGRPAAYDIEARWAEAGLGWISLTDPRNFAHGRHHGVTRFGPDAMIVSLETLAEERLFDELFGVVPDSIEVCRLRSTAPGPSAAIELVIRTMRLAGAVASLQGFDPGRPKVPEFGRRLYHLGIPTECLPKTPSIAEIAVKRKVGPQVWRAATPEIRDAWLAQPAAWCRAACAQSFGAVVFDFDGTLCETRHRTRPLQSGVQDILRGLLEAGVLVGVATGRGESAQTSLRAALPTALWHSVLVGSHNGSDVSWLDEEMSELDGTTEDVALIRTVEEELNCSPYAGLLKRIHANRHQVSVSADIPVERLRDIVIASSPAAEGLDIRCSGHSVDLVPRHARKVKVIERLHEALAGRANNLEVMAIGDQGQVGGNDFQLLDHRWSLSLDRVSPRLDRCWNFSPPGIRGPAALAHYFVRLLGLRDGAVHVHDRLEDGTRRRAMR